MNVKIFEQHLKNLDVIRKRMAVLSVLGRPVIEFNNGENKRIEFESNRPLYMS